MILKKFQYKTSQFVFRSNKRIFASMEQKYAHFSRKKIPSEQRRILQYFSTIPIDDDFSIENCSQNKDILIYFMCCCTHIVFLSRKKNNSEQKCCIFSKYEDAFNLIRSFAYCRFIIQWLIIKYMILWKLLKIAFSILLNKMRLMLCGLWPKGKLCAVSSS